MRFCNLFTNLKITCCEKHLKGSKLTARVSPVRIWSAKNGQCRQCVVRKTVNRARKSDHHPVSSWNQKGCGKIAGTGNSQSNSQARSWSQAKKDRKTTTIAERHSHAAETIHLKHTHTHTHTHTHLVHHRATARIRSSSNSQ